MPVKTQSETNQSAVLMSLQPRLEEEANNENQTEETDRGLSQAGSGSRRTTGYMIPQRKTDEFRSN